MPKLPQTENALVNYSAGQDYMFGVHEGADPRVGVSGRNIGEVPFDPVRHNPLSINQFSIWEQILEVPHVKVNLPGRPLNTNIVVHQPESVGLDKTENWGVHRRWLGRQIGAAIADSMPGITDRTWVYALGGAAYEVSEPDTEILDTSGDFEREAGMIAEVCRQGLTFVISDFREMPLFQRPAEDFPATVAIKANVATDLAIPKTDLVLRSGIKAGEVDPRQYQAVQEANGYLLRNHERILGRLAGVGIAVAEAVLPQDNPLQWATRATDSSIAQAIHTLSQRQA